jgi:hypothetical protein
MNIHTGTLIQKCTGMNMHTGTLAQKCTGMNIHTGTLAHKCTGMNILKVGKTQEGGLNCVSFFDLKQVMQRIKS